MPYKVVFTPHASEDVRRLQEAYPEALNKLAKLLDELKEHHEQGQAKLSV